eukprot:6212111-Pleurochrysis_carterae.AAC.7
MQARLDVLEDHRVVEVDVVALRVHAQPRHHSEPARLVRVGLQYDGALLLRALGGQVGHHQMLARVGVLQLHDVAVAHDAAHRLAKLGQVLDPLALAVLLQLAHALARDPLGAVELAHRQPVRLEHRMQRAHSRVVVLWPNHERAVMSEVWLQLRAHRHAYLHVGEALSAQVAAISHRRIREENGVAKPQQRRR